MQLSSTSKQERLKKRKLEEGFINPPMICRGKPFWAWNDLCEEKELRRQIRIFKEMGFGGFFMHARTGLKTPYLGREWFKAIQTCIDEASKLQMEAWLYDEDRWPSGSAGGLATKDVKYRMKYLVYEKVAPADFSWDCESCGKYVFAIRTKDEKLEEYTALKRPEDLKMARNANFILVFHIRTFNPRTPYNGGAYLDTIDTESVSKFIEITHEAYLQQVGDSFGVTVPGIFTDEPNCRHALGDKEQATWTDSLPKRFREYFGYDLVQKLPELFFDRADGKFSKARYDYYVCRSQMFIEAYAKQIGQWCGKHNLSFTGHGINEAPLSEQAMCSGSLMPFYAHMQIPGIDMLTDYRNEYITPKQCSSVARQFGKKWVLSEMYGCTGWDTTFATYKHIGDWQAVLGITMRCLHLSWYSMAGEAKRDYPASIHFHSPWWKEYLKLENYFARLNAVLTLGNAVCNVAVVNPIESYYFKWRADVGTREHDDTIKAMDNLYASLTKWVLGAHVDFDFIDEALLPEQRVNVTRHDEVLFNVGKMSYKVIVVPPMLTIRRSTLKLLKEFTEQGGKVIFIKDVPEYIDAEYCADAKVFAQDKCIELNKTVLSNALQKHCREISIRDEDGRELEEIFHQLRKVDGDAVLFVSSIDLNQEYKKIFIRMEDSELENIQVQLWDAMSGKRYALTHIQLSESELEFCVDIPVGESRLFVISHIHENLPEYVLVSKTEAFSIKHDQWDYTLDDHNVLVLDRADCTLMQKGKSILNLNSQEILRIDDIVREKLHYSKRTGAEIQPWAREKIRNAEDRNIILKYEFFIDNLPESEIKLAIEQPENWKIKLNEYLVQWPAELNDWWVDPAIKTVTVPASFLRTSKNILTIEGAFNEDVDLEMIYLLGDFAVSTDGIQSTMQKMPEKLKLGAVTTQGLPFYSGNIAYKSSFNFAPKPDSRYWFEAKDFKASAIEISINGFEPVLCSHSQDKIEITDMLKKGRNEVCINLLGSRRNSFGPLHMSDERPVYISAASFRQNEYYKWQEKYKLVEYGLYQSPVIYECEG